MPYLVVHRVLNEKLGFGTLIAVRLYGGQVRKIDIDFDSQSKMKTFMAPFDKFKIS